MRKFTDVSQTAETNYLTSLQINQLATMRVPLYRKRTHNTSTKATSMNGSQVCILLGLP